jgi:hypothetical protein
MIMNNLHESHNSRTQGLDGRRNPPQQRCYFNHFSSELLYWVEIVSIAATPYRLARIFSIRFKTDNKILSTSITFSTVLIEGI